MQSLCLPFVASVIATGRWHSTVWYFSPFTLEEKALHLDGAGSGEEECNGERRHVACPRGDSRYLTFRSSPALSSQSESAVFGGEGCGGWACHHFILLLIEEMFPVESLCLGSGNLVKWNVVHPRRLLGVKGLTFTWLQV